MPSPLHQRKRVILTALLLILIGGLAPSYPASAQIIAQGSTRSIPPHLQRYFDEANANAGGTPLKIKENTDLILLQPLDDSTTSLPASSGIKIFFDYFNLSWPWILGVAAGLAVLQAMIGGMQMMMSIGGSRDDGKERMMWATVGLLIIALAGMILNTINPLFYS